MSDIARLVLVACAFLSGCGLLESNDGRTPPNSAERPTWLPRLEPQPSQTPTATPSAPPRACHEIYDPGLLPTFSLEIDPDDLEALERERPMRIEDFHPATFRYDGETHSVMVRNRGQRSSCGEKLQLAISFNRVDREHRFRGLRRINLDHGSCKPLNERLALDFLRERVGLNAACANNARLEINGSYYGLYTNIEHVNRDFLDRNFDGPDGNLYTYDGERKNNEDDLDTSDWDQVDDTETLEELEPIMDLEHAVRLWAALAILPARDGLWCCDRNYYLYHHPSAGWLYIPHDLDHGVPDTEDTDDTIMPAEHPPSTFVLEDPAWRARFVDAVAEAQAHYIPEEFEARIDVWWPQIKDAAIDDRFLTKFKNLEDGEDPFEDLRGYLHRRAAYNQAWLESEGSAPP